MNYKNTTPIPIYVRIDGNGQFINPGEEVLSNSDLLSFGLTATLKEEPLKVSTKKPTPEKKKVTPNSKPVNTNELTNTDKTKD